MPTWDSAPADDLWTEACGKERWLGTTETLEQDIRRVSDAGSGNFAPPPAGRLLNTLADECPGNWLPQARRPRRWTRRSTCLIPTL